MTASSRYKKAEEQICSRFVCDFDQAFFKEPNFWVTAFRVLTGLNLCGFVESKFVFDTTKELSLSMLSPFTYSAQVMNFLKAFSSFILFMFISLEQPRQIILISLPILAMLNLYEPQG